MKIAGDVTIEGDCSLRGGIDMTLSEIGGALTALGQTFDNPGGVALDLSSCRIGGSLRLNFATVAASTNIIRTTFRGSLVLRDAVVGGSLLMSDAKLSQGAGVRKLALLHAPGAHIGRDVNLTRVHTTGGSVWFGGARIDGDFGADGAHLHNQGGHSLSMGQAHIAGSMLFRSVDGQRTESFSSEGLVALNRASVAGRVVIDGASMCWSSPSTVDWNQHGAAFEAIGASIGVALVLGWHHVVGAVDLTGATAASLADDPALWGDSLRVTGFTYERFAELPRKSTANWSVAERAAWLGKQDPLDPGPFEQAASVFRSRGLGRESERLLIAGRRLRRAEAFKNSASLQRWPRRFIDFVFEKFFGYGLRPARAVAALGVLFLLSLVPAHVAYRSEVLKATDGNGRVFTSEGEQGTAEPTAVVNAPNAPSKPQPVNNVDVPTRPRCGSGLVTCFNPVLYAIDTVVPIVDLGQRSTWRIDLDASNDALFYLIWFALMTCLGWAFSAVAALTFHRFGN